MKKEKDEQMIAKRHKFCQKGDYAEGEKRKTLSRLCSGLNLEDQEWCRGTTGGIYWWWIKENQKNAWGTKRKKGGGVGGG